MKHWLIEYSIKYTDGRQKEEQAKLTAKNITIAVAMALTNISGPLLQDPDVSDVVIWNCGIIEDDVF